MVADKWCCEDEKVGVTGDGCDARAGLIHAHQRETVRQNCGGIQEKAKFPEN